MTRARKAVERIVTDILDRRGLSGTWDSIDTDIQEEIKHVWEEIIMEELAEIQFRAVKSSNIAAVGHQDGNLYIKFLSGATYRYPEVSEAQYGELLTAPSVGKHFHAMGIKSRGVKI